MDKILARTVLEAGRTDGIYAEVKNEIDLRSTLAIIQKHGVILGFNTCLFGNEIVIMVNNGSTIKMDFHVYCSDEWKNRMLDNSNIHSSISKYNNEWLNAVKHEAVKRLVIPLFIIFAATIVFVSGLFAFKNRAQLYQTMAIALNISLLVFGYWRAVSHYLYSIHFSKMVLTYASAIRKAIKEREINTRIKLKKERS